MPHKLYIEQADGEMSTLTIIENDDDLPTPTDEEYESYGVKEDAIAKLKDIHETIRLYTKLRDRGLSKTPWSRR